MAYRYDPQKPLFRKLTDTEEIAFREYARKNDPPPNPDFWETYHPICREEWTKRGLGPNHKGTIDR
jgi:hypothetical protein